MAVYVDWKLLRSVSTTQAGLNRTSAEISRIKAQLSAESAELKARQDILASRTKAYARLRGDVSPFRQRIARMLRMLAADRSKFGPCDPIKLNPGYVFAAQGFSWELLQNESYNRSQRIVIRYDLQTNYGPLIAQFAARGLDTTHLLDLAEEWRIGPEEARGIAMSQGLSWKLASQAYEATSASIQKELGDYIGPDSLATYRAFTTGQYLTDEVNQHLSYSGTTLTPEQYVTLAALIGNSNNPRGSLEGWVTSDVLAGSRSFLSADQLQALQGFVVDPAK